MKLWVFKTEWNLVPNIYIWLNIASYKYVLQSYILFTANDQFYLWWVIKPQRSKKKPEEH